MHHFGNVTFANDFPSFVDSSVVTVVENSLSVNEQECVFVRKTLEPKMCHISMSSSFGKPLLFYCRHLWSSPAGLGFSTRLAQAADSLSGERILTPLPRPHCSPLWSPSLIRDAATVVDVKTHLCHALHHLLAVHRFCQQVRWVVVGAHLLHSQLALLHFVLYPEVLDLNMPRLPKALAMRCATGR